MMHWTTFVLILVGILVAGFVALMVATMKYEAEKLKAQAMSIANVTAKTITAKKAKTTKEKK